MTTTSSPSTADATGATPALRCQGLRKRYDDVIAVDGLDLEVRRGECMGLLGPNGAGKTTTVEILEGLLPPDAGTVEVLGQRWGQGHDDALRARIGIQLQETQLADRLTVGEVLRLFRSFYPRGRSVDEVIALVELEPKRGAQVHKLSGGQRQRLALACALVSDPEVLFLDEPTTGLDPQARQRVWQVVEDFRGRGGTTLLTTHYMEEAARLCDRVAVVDSGTVIALGTPAALIDALDAEQVIAFELETELPAGLLDGLAGVTATTRQRERHVLHVRQVSQVLPALLQRIEARGLSLRSIDTHRPTLDDVFVHLTGRSLRDA